MNPTVPRTACLSHTKGFLDERNSTDDDERGSSSLSLTKATTTNKTNNQPQHDLFNQLLDHEQPNNEATSLNVDLLNELAACPHAHLIPPGSASWDRLVLGWHAPSGRASSLSANRDSRHAPCSST